MIHLYVRNDSFICVTFIRDTTYSYTTLAYSYAWHNASTRTQSRAKISSLSAILGTHYKEGTRVSFVLCTCTHVPTAVQINVYSISWTHVTRGIHGCVILTNVIMSRSVCVCVHVCGSVRVVCVCVMYVLCVCVWCTNYCSGVDMYQLVYTSVLTWTNYHTYMCRQVPTPPHTCIDMYHLLHTGVHKRQLVRTYVIRVGYESRTYQLLYTYVLTCTTYCTQVSTNAN